MAQCRRAEKSGECEASQNDGSQIFSKSCESRRNSNAMLALAQRKKIRHRSPKIVKNNKNRLLHILIQLVCLTSWLISPGLKAADPELPVRTDLELPTVASASTEIYAGVTLVQPNGFKLQPGAQINLIQNLPDSRCYVMGAANYAAANADLNSTIAGQKIDASGGFSTAEVGFGCYPFGSWRRHWVGEPMLVDFFMMTSLGQSRFLGESGNVVSWGGGLRITRADGAALRINLTDQLFRRTMLGQESTEHVLMIGLSVGILF